jgi:drug/metabolite transporter (DMT)-like permease
MSRTVTISLALFCVALTSAAQISLKVGVSNIALRALPVTGAPLMFLSRALLAPAVLAGLVLYAASTLLWLMVLAKSDVSFVYPFVSLGFVLIALYGHLVLHEPLIPLRAAGIALITVGVVCIAKSS